MAHRLVSGGGKTYYFLSTLRSTEVINKNLFPKFSNNLRNTFLRNKNLKMKLIATQNS